jgi:hypothetical protein
LVEPVFSRPAAPPPAELTSAAQALLTNLAVILKAAERPLEVETLTRGAEELRSANTLTAPPRPARDTNLDHGAAGS